MPDLPIRLVAEALDASVSWDGTRAFVSTHDPPEFTEGQIVNALRVAGHIIQACAEVELESDARLCRDALQHPLPFWEVTPQLYRAAEKYARDQNDQCDVTDEMLETISEFQGFSSDVVRERLTPNEICFLYLYRQVVREGLAVGDWQPWYNPAAYVRFVQLYERVDRRRASDPPNVEYMSGMIWLALGFHASLTDIGDIGEGNLDVLAQKMGWRETARLPDGTELDARDYNNWRRRIYGSRVNGPDRVFFKTTGGVQEEVILPESGADIGIPLYNHRLRHTAGWATAAPKSTLTTTMSPWRMSTWLWIWRTRRL